MANKVDGKMRSKSIRMTLAGISAGSRTKPARDASVRLSLTRLPRRAPAEPSSKAAPRLTSQSKNELATTR